MKKKTIKQPNTKCLTCNKEFYIKPFALTRNRGRYCSKICKNISQMNRIEKICPVCDKSFSIKESLEINNRFIRCSKKCRDIFRKANARVIIKKGTPSGDKHWNWKGGTTLLADKIRNSTEYKKFRKSVFERDNYTCQSCKNRGSYLQMDHIKPFSIFPELIYETTNCKTLCIDCHRKTDTYGTKLLFLIKKYGKEKLRKFYESV